MAITHSDCVRRQLRHASSLLIRARRGIGQVWFDVQPGDLSTAGSCATALARRHRAGSLGRVEVTDRDDMPPGLHDPRAGARRAEAVPGPSAAGAVHEAAGQRDAVSRAVARGKPVAASVVIPR